MRRVLSVLILLVLFPTASAIAATLTYTAALSQANETSIGAASTGSGLITVTLNGNILTVNESWTGLTGAATGAHIHCCAAPGATAAVEVPFTSFPATSSGVYTNTFDLSTLTYTAGFTEAQLLAGLSNGLAYANIHTANNPGGEIRGQLLLPAPEPSSVMLLGTGLLGGVGLLRRRFVG